MESSSHDPCWHQVFACFLLSSLFVGSLYVWRSGRGRNHPTTIKQRFFSVFIIILISPFVVNFFITSSRFQKFTIFELTGFRLPGLIPALFFPLLLTMLLFLGPLCMQNYREIWKSFSSYHFWLSNVTDLVWLRNIIVGPLAEEFTFRACMIPLLLECLKPLSAVFVCAFIFGLAHIHHAFEMYSAGDPFIAVCLNEAFQFSYTTLFGAYSGYVFLQTGHFTSVFVIHAFCNTLAFLNFSKMFTYKNPKKIILIFLHIFGVVLWGLLLNPVLNYELYDNYVYFGKEES